MRTKYHNESKNIYKKENIKVKKVTFNEEKENIIEILMKRVEELEKKVKNWRRLEMKVEDMEKILNDREQ